MLPDKNPPQDDKLIAFLKQHQPLCPPSPPLFEEQLMEIIARSPRKISSRPKHLGVITLMAICAGLGFGLSKINSPQPQLAEQLTDREREEIVSYLLDDWPAKTSQDGITDQSPDQSFSQEWLEVITE